MKDYTVVYSSPSIEAFKNLIQEMLKTFSIPLNSNDFAYYGVFCKPETYAFYKHWDDAPDSLDVPLILKNPLEIPNTKLMYVKSEINKILINGDKKPEWMFYVEEEDNFSKYCLAPSTFLYIRPKHEKYRNLCEKLTEFLYSPNMLITMIN